MGSCSAAIFCFIKKKAKGFPLPSGLARKHGFVLELTLLKKHLQIRIQINSNNS
jgi:hypothetical protein